MDFDSLQEILFTLRKNKLRTILTAFGVFWGIMMLILLLGAGRGLENGADRQFGTDDRSSIWINGYKTAVPYKGYPPGRTIEFTEDDIDAIKREVPHVKHISAENRAGAHWQRTINVSYKNESGAFGVHGVANDFFKIKKYIEYRAGRTLNSLDSGDARKVAIIGTAVRDRLYPPGIDPLGTYISFHGVMLKVVGVFYDEAREGRMSERVYIPLETFQKTFGRARKIGQITLTPTADVDPFEFEEKVTALLKFRHSVAPNDTRAISVFNYARQMQTVTQMFTAIGTFVWFVGLGTLAAGVVGISNIMIITVKDRTREIGVRKALGATPFSIVSMILMESILVTAIAGYAGLVLGVGLLELMASVIEKMGDKVAYFSNPEVDLGTAIKALVVLVLSGAAAGLTPAMRAARILPIEAMREE